MTASTTTVSPPSTSASPATAPRLVLVGLIVAISMTTIDQTIVSLASPTLQSGLGISGSAVEWAINAYLLAAAASFPLAGRLADVLGYRRMMLSGILVFALASASCGLTPSGSHADIWLITARTIQGIGSALMFPAAIGLLVGTTDPSRRARSMAAFFAISGAMTAIGPMAGAVLIPWSWRSIFFINLPLAVFSIVLLFASTPRGGGSREPIDWLGGSLAAATMFLLVLPLQRGNDWGWTSAATLGCFAGAVVFLIVFVLVERRTEHPVLKIAVFGSRAFVVSTSGSLLGAVCFIPIMFFGSVYGQLSLRLSLIDSSLLLLKFFLGFMLAAQLGARIFERRGIRPVFAAAGLLGAAGFGWLAHTATDIASAASGSWLDQQTFALVLAGASVGLMFSPAATDMVNRAIGASYGEVTAITQTMKNFGGALGIAAFSSLATHRFADQLITGLAPFGVNAQTARQLSTSVTSSSQDHAAQSRLAAVPPQVQEKILDIVRHSYAVAVQGVFWTMGAVMLGLCMLAVLYPRHPSGDKDAQELSPDERSDTPQPSAAGSLDV